MNFPKLMDDPEVDLPPEESPDISPAQDEDHNLELSARRKLRFSWEARDETVLERIKEIANDQVYELFAGAVEEMDRFYEALRVPRMRNGAQVVDARGRPVWEENGSGPVEDWDRLTGQDIEQTLMNLERLKIAVAPRVNELKNDALFAKMASQDIKDDVWDSVKSSATIGDRSAKANKAARQESYHAFFRYVLWSNADIFLQQIITFQKRLSDMRYWRIQDQR